jgi:hypothetical protein
MGLEISKTNALLDVKRIRGGLEMHTQNSVLEYRQKRVKVNIETELSKVEIGQYEAFASAGLKNAMDQAKDTAQRGYNQALEYIAKVAQDGDALAAIEKGGNPIAEIAVRDAYPVHEFGLDTIPKVGPRFNVKGGGIRFEPHTDGQGTAGVEGTYTPGRVNISYTPDDVRIFTKQYPSIQIKYTGENVDVRL